MQENIFENSPGKLLCEQSGTCSETLLFASAIFNELSCPLLQTSLLLSCKCNKLALEQLVLHNQNSEVCIKTSAAIQRPGYWADNCKMVNCPWTLCQRVWCCVTERGPELDYISLSWFSSGSSSVKGGKPENPGKNPRSKDEHQQNTRPNPGHNDGRWVFSPLCHLCSTNCTCTS